MADHLAAAFAHAFELARAKTPEEAAWDDARNHLNAIEAKIGRWCAAFGKPPTDQHLRDLDQAQDAERTVWHNYWRTT